MGDRCRARLVLFARRHARDCATVALDCCWRSSFRSCSGWLGAWLLAQGGSSRCDHCIFRDGDRRRAVRWRRRRSATAARSTASRRRTRCASCWWCLIVPFAFNAMNVHGLDPYAPLAKTFSWTGFLVLVAITAAAAAVMERFGSPNSWMIGPLLAAALITATGHRFSTLPRAVVNAGQLLIGISLGVALHTANSSGAAPRFLSAVAAIITALHAAGGADLRAACARLGPAVADGDDRDDARGYRRDGVDRAGVTAWCADRDRVSHDSPACAVADGRRNVSILEKVDGAPCKLKRLRSSWRRHWRRNSS